jgi:hypothetical protein
MFPPALRAKRPGDGMTSQVLAKQVLANFLPSLAKVRLANMMRRTKLIRNIHKELLLLAHQAQSSKPPGRCRGFRNSPQRSGK